MGFLKTDVGRARAWMRLCIEQRTLYQELELFMNAQSVMANFFKGYAFLLQAECRLALLTHLLALTTVDLQAFSPKYPALDDVAYTIRLRTTRGFNCGTSANVFVTVHGTLATTDRITCPRGATLSSGAVHEVLLHHRNLGAITGVELAHDRMGTSAGWSPRDVTITNALTRGTAYIPCGDCRLHKDAHDSVYFAFTNAQPNDTGGT